MLLEAKDIRVSFRKENQTRLFGRERQEVLHGLSIDLKEGSISTAASRAPTKRAFSRAFPLFFRITPLRPIRAFAYRALLGNPSVPCV